MRMIHTSDWHLGNSLHDVDRTEEQRAFLKWLNTQIKEMKADTLIVSGDVFDVKRPKADAEKLYFEFLSGLDETFCKNVVITGGNHDSGARLEVTKSIVKKFNVHVVGKVEGGDVDNMVLELKDQEGSSYAIVIAIPFMDESNLKNYYEGEADGTFSDRAYEALFRKCLERAKAIKGKRNLPIIAMAHLYAAGLEGRYEGVDEETATDDGVKVLDVVGNLGKVHSNVFPEELDYVGLGHIHYSTAVGKEKRIRYSGSPFVMGYDDSDVQHYILQVDINPDKTEDRIEVEKIQVPQTVKFLRLGKTKEEICDKLREIIEEYGEEDSDSDEEKQPIYLELQYNAEEGTTLFNEIDQMNLPAGVEIVSWNPIKKAVGDSMMFADGRDVRSMANISLDEIVRHLVLTKAPIREEEKEGKSDEEIREMEKALVNKYMPYFKRALNHVEVNKDEDTEA